MGDTSDSGGPLIESYRDRPLEVASMVFSFAMGSILTLLGVVLVLIVNT